MYDPIKYWSRRTDLKDHGAPGWAEDYIRKHLQGPNVLDYGPGDGGKFHLMNGHEVWGVDIVDTYKDKAIKRAVELDLKYNHIVGDIIGFPDKFFNSALASKILLHVPISDIDRVVAELQRVSHRVIVWDTVTPTDAEHVTVHPFHQIMPMKNAIIKHGQILFHT